MSEFAKFELDDGTAVLFETADSDLVRQHRGGAEATDGGALGERLAGAAQTAEEVSKTLRQRLAPDELTLELGLKVSGQANWFVAKAATEGNIKVTLKWKPETAHSARDAIPANRGEDPTAGSEAGPRS